MNSISTKMLKHYLQIYKQGTPTRFACKNVACRVFLIESGIRCSSCIKGNKSIYVGYVD